MGGRDTMEWVGRKVEILRRRQIPSTAVSSARAPLLQDDSFWGWVEGEQATARTKYGGSSLRSE